MIEDCKTIIKKVFAIIMNVRTSIKKLGLNQNLYFTLLLD